LAEMFWEPAVSPTCIHNVCKYVPHRLSYTQNVAVIRGLTVKVPVFLLSLSMEFLATCIKR
jgi:hypothetical protein